MEQTQVPAPPRPWLERLPFILFLGWLLPVLGWTVSFVLTVTLASSPKELLFYSLIFGGMLGTLMFVVAPPFLLIAVLMSRLKLNRTWVCPLALLPAVLVSGYLLWQAIETRLPGGEARRFSWYTGMTWPIEARCVLTRHGWGMQDKRHLWVFEGTPAAFEQHKMQLEWTRSEDQEADFAKTGTLGRCPIDTIRAALGGAWHPAEIFWWEAGKDAKSGPFGPAWLLVNREYTRWCIWWDGV